MSELKLDVGSLHYEVHGDHGPWLFFVSGLGGRGSFWEGQVSHFQNDFRVVTHDHRGYGNSSGWSENSGIDQASQDLKRLLDALSVDKAILAGHSMGGMIVQQFANQHPEYIEALVVSGSGPYVDEFARLVLEFRRLLIEKTGREGYCRFQTLMTIGKMKNALTMDQIIALEANSIKGTPDSALVSARIKSISEFDSRRYLPDINVPTLVLSARDDDTAPVAGGASLSDLIPNAELKLLEKGGHFFPRMVPAEYNRQVEEFVSKLG